MDYVKLCMHTKINVPAVNGLWTDRRTTGLEQEVAQATNWSGTGSELEENGEIAGEQAKNRNGTGNIAKFGNPRIWQIWQFQNG
jgi:hypothetical protein